MNYIFTSIVSMLCVVVVLLLSGCTTEDSDGASWIDDYTPVHSVGTGDTDFWIAYPPTNPSSGQAVNHLAWVNDSLKEACVLFVVHRTGCVGCQAQADRVIALAEKYETQVEFYDLDIALGGATEQRAYDAYVYDPAGPPGYIALTGVFTFVKQNGVVEYGWHSWEGNVGDGEMESWVQDAIYYYHVNK